MNSLSQTDVSPADVCGHSAHIPCSAGQYMATVVEQEPMARNTFRLRLRCPELAKRIVPGQFFMVRPARGSDPLLGRPFALFDTFDENGQPAGLDFGYVTVGKLTGLMPTWHVGDEVSIWGPLGNGFPVVTDDCQHLMCVAGGIGQTPFLAVARETLGLRRYGQPLRSAGEKPQRMSLCYGARSADVPLHRCRSAHRQRRLPSPHKASRPGYGHPECRCSSRVPPWAGTGDTHRQRAECGPGDRFRRPVRSCSNCLLRAVRPLRPHRRSPS